MSSPVPAGHRLFAQYAHAPNALGYCGPQGSGLQSVACGRGAEVDVPRLARQFSGAWPYQQVVAELAGIDDPLDDRVVRAYWTGNDLTGDVDRTEFGTRLLELIAPQARHYWSHLTADLLVEASPTHLFHVLGVYPWSRLLGAGRPEPLQVLDSCRIRCATVLEVDGDQVILRSRRLGFDGRALSLGPELDEPAQYRLEGGYRLEDGNRLEADTFVGDLRAGDEVAVHWDFVCDRLTPDEAECLRHWTQWQLAATNPRLAATAAT